MRRALHVVGGGAVTPAGLDWPQTSAALRGALSAFEEITLAQPFGTSQIVARIPSHWRLRETDGAWLTNMAARAVLEALGDSPSDGAVLLLAPPESFREHPAFETIRPSDFLARVILATGRKFHPGSRAVDGGAAASIGLLTQALDLLEDGARSVLLGGVDSLVNDRDIARLDAAGRLKREDNAQGLVPGEGAVFVRLALVPERAAPLWATVHGVGVASETDSVLSDRQSQGRALLSAYRDALAAPGGPREPDVGFLVSNGSGERYQGLETLVARARFFRTRREKLIVGYPAATLGEIGAAGGALAVLIAADSFTRGVAPSPVALAEVFSETGLRAAASLAAGRA